MRVSPWAAGPGPEVSRAQILGPMGQTRWFAALALVVWSTGCSSTGQSSGQSSGLSPAVVRRPSTDPAVVLGPHSLSQGRPPVVDGDTIRVEGLQGSLRLIGIDTEETFKDKGMRKLASEDWAEYLRTVSSGARAERPPKYGTPMGEAARRFAEGFFENVESVRLEYDDPVRKLGYFRRHLVHVLVQSGEHLLNFNVEVVRQGLSPYYKKYGRSARYHAAFTAAEAEARAYRRGIWADPPRFHCYPDYEVRLAWWSERDWAYQRLIRLKRTMKDDLAILGDDAEWERLKSMTGRKVTVAGSPGRFHRAGSLGIQYMGHRSGMDFAVVGPAAAFQQHAIRKHDGDVILVSGTVELYRGRPQFKLETVTISKP